MTLLVPVEYRVADLFRSRVFLGCPHTDAHGNAIGTFDHVLRVTSPLYLAGRGYDRYFHEDFADAFVLIALGEPRPQLGSIPPGTSFRRRLAVLGTSTLDCALSTADHRTSESDVEQRLYSFSFEVEGAPDVVSRLLKPVQDYLIGDKQLYGLRSLG